MKILHLPICKKTLLLLLKNISKITLLIKSKKEKLQIPYIILLIY